MPSLDGVLHLMETQSYKRYTLYQDDSCKLEAEVVSRVAYLHCEVTNWKLSTARKLYSALKTFLDSCEERDIVQVYTITPNPRFAEMYGGRFCGYVTYQGKEYEVFKWALKFSQT